MTMLLKDTFSVDVAAGSVSGTYSDSGALRTVVDTNAKISITGGKLNFATGAAANDGMWYPLQTRVAGKIFLSTITPANTSLNIYVGYDSNTSAYLDYAFWFHTSGNIRVYYYLGGDVNPVIGAYTATPYQIAMIIRSSGYYWFIKGGTFTYWTLLSSSISGAGNKYPGIQANSTTSVFTADDIKIPPTLWLPTPIASDGFSGATTDGLGHPETTGLGSGGAGLTWTGATWTVAGGYVSNTPTLGAELATGNLVVGKWYSITATQANTFYTGCAVGDTFRALATTALDANNKVKEITLATLFRQLAIANANIKVRIACHALTAGTQFGCVARVATNGSSGLVLDWSGGTVKLAEWAGSTTWSALMSVTKAFAADDSIELDLSGTAFRCYHITAAGVTTLLGSGTCTVDGSLGTDAGVFDTAPGTNQGDNFVVYPKGSNNEYGILDNITEEITGTLTQTLETIGISAAGSVLVTGQASNTLDSIGIAASGSVSVNAVLSQTLEDIQGAITGFVLVTGVLNITLESISTLGVGITAINTTLGKVKIMLSSSVNVKI